MKQTRKHKSAQERALFHSGLFGHKVQRDRTKYNRKEKHRSKSVDTD